MQQVEFESLFDLLYDLWNFLNSVFKMLLLVSFSNHDWHTVSQCCVSLANMYG